MEKDLLPRAAVPHAEQYTRQSEERPPLTLFQKLDGRRGWYIPARTYGAEFIVPDERGKPQEADAQAAEYIIKNREAVEAAAVAFMREHLKVRGRYSLLYVEIFGETDKYGAKALACFSNDEDCRMSIDVGLREGGPLPFARPCYAVIHY